MMEKGVVIVGAGQGGTQLAVSLREKGFGGPVTVIGEEPDLPYQRPPLSKAFLKGECDEDGLMLRPAEVYPELEIDLRRGVRVESIDRPAKTVRLSDGASLAYETLVLASGARLRRFAALEGARNVAYLRDLAEARALSERLGRARRVAVIGAGFIGLEVAGTARARGCEVTVLEAAPRVMGRAASPELAAWCLDLHRANGVEMRLATGTITPERDETVVKALEFGGGERIEADLVVCGIGVVPRDELARACGLPAGNGIVVDSRLRTADPAILAIGDCCAFPSPVDGRLVRLESVQNAVAQAKFAADGIVGSDAPYRAVPWFWTEQFGNRIQIAGLSLEGCSVTVMGDLAAGKFSFEHRAAGALAFVESVNDPARHIAARRGLEQLWCGVDDRGVRAS